MKQKKQIKPQRSTTVSLAPGAGGARTKSGTNRVAALVRMHARRLRTAYRLAVATLALTGCAGLLPHSNQQTETPWRDYSGAAAMFDSIIPGQTSLSELKALGVDPERTPNVALLAHADLLRRLVGTSSPGRYLVF